MKVAHLIKYVYSRLYGVTEIFSKYVLTGLIFAQFKLLVDNGYLYGQQKKERELFK